MYFRVDSLALSLILCAAANIFQRAAVQNYLALSVAFIYSEAPILPDFMGIVGGWIWAIGVH